MTIINSWGDCRSLEWATQHYKGGMQAEEASPPSHIANVTQNWKGSFGDCHGPFTHTFQRYLEISFHYRPPWIVASMD